VGSEWQHEKWLSTFCAAKPEAIVKPARTSGTTQAERLERDEADALTAVLRGVTAYTVVVGFTTVYAHARLNGGARMYAGLSTCAAVPAHALCLTAVNAVVKVCLLNVVMAWADYIRRDAAAARRVVGLESVLQH
jgi:hypothetical protein